jgi:bifunctional DNA-binding transcriptional regulator/antitoxin component of YhaV-PrlF toxin-antitoxin module
LLRDEVGDMPSLERRKIHAAGSSLAITLPPGWLRYFGLKAGDELEILADGDLVIRPICSPEAEGILQVRSTPGHGGKDVHAASQ